MDGLFSTQGAVGQFVVLVACLLGRTFSFFGFDGTCSSLALISVGVLSLLRPVVLSLLPLLTIILRLSCGRPVPPADGRLLGRLRLAPASARFPHVTKVERGIFQPSRSMRLLGC